MRFTLFLPLILASLGCVQDEVKPAAPAPAAPKTERPTVPGPTDNAEVAAAMNNMLAELARLRTTVKTLSAQVDSLQMANQRNEAEKADLMARLARAQDALAEATKTPAGSGAGTSGTVIVILRDGTPGFYCQPPERRPILPWRR